MTLKVDFTADEFQELADAVENYMVDIEDVLKEDNEKAEFYENLRLKCTSLSVLLELQKKGVVNE